MRKLTSWVLYWAGDRVSWLISRLPWRADRTAYCLDRVYQRLMSWSERVQGDGDGPWVPSEFLTEEGIARMKAEIEKISACAHEWQAPEQQSFDLGEKFYPAEYCPKCAATQYRPKKSIDIV